MDHDLSSAPPQRILVIPERDVGASLVTAPARLHHWRSATGAAEGVGLVGLQGHPALISNYHDGHASLEETQNAALRIANAAEEATRGKSKERSDSPVHEEDGAGDHAENYIAFNWGNSPPDPWTAESEEDRAGSYHFGCLSIAFCAAATCRAAKRSQGRCDCRKDGLAVRLCS
jgi:hypothetical protein